MSEFWVGDTTYFWGLDTMEQSTQNFKKIASNFKGNHTTTVGKHYTAAHHSTYHPPSTTPTYGLAYPAMICVI
jgi:hypothetical protein